MSIVNENIRLAGSPMTILRAAGNVASYFWMGTLVRKGLEPSRSFERFYSIPSDSGVVEGDLIQAGSEFFLVASLSRTETFGELLCFQGTLYRCNSVVTVKRYDGDLKTFPVVKSGVRCLISREINRVRSEDDRAAAGFYQKGQGPVFTLFAQESEGIDSGSLLEDQAGRSFRVSDDTNPTLAGGLTMADLVMEGLA